MTRKTIIASTVAIMMPMQQRIFVAPCLEAIVAFVIGTTFGGCRCMICPQDGHLAAAEPYGNDWKYEAVSARNDA